MVSSKFSLALITALPLLVIPAAVAQTSNLEVAPKSNPNNDRFLQSPPPSQFSPPKDRELKIIPIQPHRRNSHLSRKQPKDFGEKD